MSTEKKERQKQPQAGQPPCGVLSMALGGSLLMWLCQPPVGWSGLAWLAPVPWLLLVRWHELNSRRPYRAIWLAATVHWLLTIHWIRLPHPANYAAWIVLATVMGAYLPLFVALARVGVHRLHLPLWIVAPVAWTGVEWLRAHLLTGFFMGSLAHTQVAWPWVIQIADIFGEYGVTFLIVLVASCITQVSLPWSRSNTGKPWHWRSLLSLLPGGFALAAALVYGHSRSIDVALAQKSPANYRIALIQGYTRADWKSDPEKQRSIMEEYLRLSHEAVAQVKQQGDGKPIDLLVWPETTFRTPLLALDPDHPPPSGAIARQNLEAAPRDLAELVHQLGTAVLVGTDRYNAMAASPQDAAHGHAYHFKTYNSAVMAGRDGKIVGTYDKMHRVMFGEYIPFAEWFPMLYGLTPLTGGIDAGKEPAGLWLDDVLYAPNICYETVLPHVIRRQVKYLESRYSSKPHVLVNLTNDAWYRGSSELDMHLACGVFRAIEMRTPMVIAANGGLSAHINRYGTVQQVTERLKPQTLIVDVQGDHCNSIYTDWGDWFAIGCLLCCIVLAVLQRNTRRIAL